MEPPTKRPRHGAAPSESDDNDGEDDDELCSHPQIVSAKRDPGFKLSVKRAHADHKFQSTMAHIIDKYSHNFEGIGDEIDLETGEIVVNNGHVHNMRDEGDIGEGWASQQDDEDEGILLEDLTDGCSDDQDDVADERLPERGQRSEKSHETEELAPAGKETVSTFAALVPAAGSIPGQNNHDARLSTLFQNPYAGFPPFGFGTPPMGSGNPQFPFGQMPYSLPSWGMPNCFPAAGWGLPRPNMALQGTQSGYGYPAQDGRSSIWASGSGYENHWDPRLSMRMGVRKKPQRESRKALGASGAGDSGAVQGGSQEANSSHSFTAEGNTEIVRSTISDSEEEDDLTLPTDSPSGGQPKLSPKQIKGVLVKKGSRTPVKDHQHRSPKSANKRKRTASGVPLRKTAAERERETTAMNSHDECIPAEGAQVDYGDRRRSGRVRKRVEYMGKVSWSQVVEERRSNQALSVELQSPNPESRGEFIRVGNEVADEANPRPSSPPKCHEPEGNKQNDAVQHPRRVIPDSQGSATPQSSAVQEQQREDKPNLLVQSGPHDATSACVLSDDEAPILLTRPKLLEKAPTPPAEAASLQEVRNDSPADSPGSSEIVHQPRKRGRPRKSEPASISRQVDSEQQVLSDVSSSVIANAKENDIEKPRKRGRPRKSDAPTAMVQISSERQAPEVELPSDLPAASKEPAENTDGADVSSAVLGEKPQRLNRELNWLKRWRKENPKLAKEIDTTVSEGDAHDQGASRTRSRSIRGKEPLKSDNGPKKEAVEADKENVTPAPSPPAEDEHHLEEAVQFPPIASSVADPQPSSTPKKSPEEQPGNQTPSKHASTPPKSKPQTPRQSSIHTTRAPSSRRSILSLLSDEDSDNDELVRVAKPALLQQPSSSKSAITRRVWRSSARTTEVYHTPVKRRMVDVISPGGMVETPGGTVRMCGLDGYRCERDFCFTCL